MATYRYREVQRYRQPWIWVMMLGSCGLVVWLFGYGMVQQLVLGRPWGNQPMSDVGLTIAFIVTLAITGGLLLLFWWMQLIVEVREDGIFLHFKPMKRRTVRFEEIESVEPCQYRPIVEYGGWGIRRGRKGWAYNVSGNKGVRVEFHDGKHLLIGSQRPAELAAAIDRARSS